MRRGLMPCLLTDHPKWGRVQVALVRRGPFVAEVTVSGPKSFTTKVNAAALGTQLQARIPSVTPTKLPYDVADLMPTSLVEARGE